ncbi:MAG: hypothetical protein PVH61_04450 [Candidatus Aminicenantes bacterium]
MKTPVFCIVNGKAIKAVRTIFGRLKILRYSPEKDEFELDMQFLEHIYFPTPTKNLDTYVVSKKEFKAYVAKLRREFLENEVYH